MPLSGKSLFEVTVTDIIIKKKNEVYVTVKAEPHINQELSDLFTFDVPGAKFMPQYRSKYWDGKIRLYSPATGEIYGGLVDKIVSWAKKSEYSLEFENNQFYGAPFEENEIISREGVKQYMYNGTILITEKVKHKINFVEMYLKGLRDDNIRNNNSIDKYLIQGGNDR